MSSSAFFASLRHRPYLKAGLLLLGLLATMSAVAANFRVVYAGTHLEKGIYYLDATIRYRFRDEPLQALQSGVPLIFGLDIQVYRQREWLWDEIVANLRQRYRLEYHALSQQYLVTNLNTGEVKSYPSLEAVTDTLGRVERLPLLDASQLRPGNTYFVRLRADIDIDALPGPLQLIAYLAPAWRLTSEWHTWPL